MTPDQKFLFDQLTQLQQRVATNVLSGMTQRQAYVDGGGTAVGEESIDASASVLLSNSKVKAFMDAMKLEAVSDAILTRKQALERLSLMANTEITDILEFRTVEVQEMRDGELETVEQTIWLMKDSPEVERRAAASIKSVTMTKFGPKIEMYDARDAIAQIAKMQGWEAAQKIDHSSKDGTMSPKGKSLDDFYGKPPDVPA